MELQGSTNQRTDWYVEWILARILIFESIKGLLMWHFILNEFNITKVASCIDALTIRNK